MQVPAEAGGIAFTGSETPGVRAAGLLDQRVSSQGPQPGPWKPWTPTDLIRNTG